MRTIPGLNSVNAVDLLDGINDVGFEGTCRESQGGLDSFASQAGVSLQKLFHGFPGRQLLEDELDSDARSVPVLW
jgi:hypothetical protein